MDSISEQPYLMILGGPNHGLTIPLKEPTTALGRHPKGDVFVDDPTVSRRHAVVQRSADGCRLWDLGSKNGTFVNRRSIRGMDYQLRDGDEICLGTSHVSLIFREFAGRFALVSSPGPGPGRRLAEEPPASSNRGEAPSPTESVIGSRYEPEAAGPSKASGALSPDQVYAGMVRLKVTAGGNSRLLDHLVDQLRRKPQFGLVQVRSDSQKDGDILLTLWEPVPLVRMLSGMEFVSQVNQLESGVPGESESRPSLQPRVLMVRLTGGPDLH